MNEIDKNIHFLNSDDGFSLMETLVAVFILSIVSLISLNIMSNFAAANQALTETLEHLEDLKTAQNYVRDDMRHVVKRPTRYKGNNNAGMVFSYNDDTVSQGQNNILLRFTRNSSMLADVDLLRPAIETIEYRIEGDKLIRRSFDRPNPTIDTPYRDYVILHNVENVGLKFLVGNNWVDEWMRIPNSTITYLPSAIEFSWDIMEKSNQLQYQYVSKFMVGTNL